MAGLAASIYLARAGCSVTIFERRRVLGGRAVTHLRQGYRFNLGPHAVYRGGASSTVYRELGIPIRGGSPANRGIAIYKGSRYRLPADALTFMITSLLSLKARLEAAKLLVRIRFLDAQKFAQMTVTEWLDANVGDERLRQTIGALMRVATYSDADQQSAAVALKQLQIATKGVIYVDEGWQKIVDALHSNAVTSGVNFVTSSHVVGVKHDGKAVQGIELGELELDLRNDTMSVALPQLPADGEQGTRIPADTAMLAVDPATARSLAGDH